MNTLDARLRAYLPAEQRQGARKYGADLPTPLEYLQAPGLPWQAATLFIAGLVNDNYSSMSY